MGGGVHAQALVWPQDKVPSASVLSEGEGDRENLHKVNPTAAPLLTWGCMLRSLRPPLRDGLSGHTPAQHFEGDPEEK